MNGEWLIAYMALLNMRWSVNGRWKGLIFKLPRPFFEIAALPSRGA
jgi:hypothetical protein